MKAFRFWISAVALGLILVGAALSFKRPAPALREVSARELTLRDGRAYWKKETTPFNGIVSETYPGGSRKSRSILANGLMHGASEGWYTNGVLQVREHFVEGISHGLREKWYPAGEKMSEATIRAGKIEGIFKRWHENGKLAEEVQMRDGQPDGSSVAYYPSGAIKARAHLKDGKVVEQKFWKEGENPTLAQISPHR